MLKSVFLSLLVIVPVQSAGISDGGAFGSPAAFVPPKNLSEAELRFSEILRGRGAFEIHDLVMGKIPAPADLDLLIQWTAENLCASSLMQALDEGRYPLTAMFGLLGREGWRRLPDEEWKRVREKLLKLGIGSVNGPTLVKNVAFAHYLNSLKGREEGLPLEERDLLTIFDKSRLKETLQRPCEVLVLPQSPSPPQRHGSAWL